MQRKALRFVLDTAAVEEAQVRARTLINEYPGGIPSLIVAAAALSFRDGARMALTDTRFAGDIDGTVRRMAERWAEAFQIEIRRLDLVAS